MAYMENGVEAGDLAEHKRRNEILEHNQWLQEQYMEYQNNIDTFKKKIVDYNTNNIKKRVELD